MKREAPAPGSIIIPAATLAEFIARAVESYGSIRSAATGIGMPFSTLRGWRRRRYSVASRSGSDAFLEHVAALRAKVEAANENVAAIRAHLDEIERMTGRG
jgi:transposase-like protein